MAKLDSAVIGCGRMGAFTSDVVKTHCPKCWLPLSHIEAVLEHPDTNLIAICDPDEVQLSKAVSVYGIDNAFQFYDALIDTVSPYLLTIATRTKERFHIIEYALRNGVRALHVEKPLCNSMQQLEDLQSLFEKSGAICTYGAIRRYLPPYVHVNELLVSGKLGELRQVQVNLGKGQLFWTHPHSVDQILYYVGDRRVQSVYAEFGDLDIGPTEARIENDPVVRLAVIQFEGEVTGIITQCDGSDTIVTGTEGMATVQCDGHSVTHRFGSKDDIYWQQANGMKAIQTGPGGTFSAIDQLVKWSRATDLSASRKSVADMVLGMRILFGMVQSALMKRAITLDEVDPSLIVLGRTGTRYA